MKYNFSVGTDIEDISRFKKINLANDISFLNKIFTKNEIKYCFSKKYPASHLAVRFAGKEAVIKALADVNQRKINILDYKKIEILNKKNGVPAVNLLDPFFRIFTVKISLSHCREKAIAFVVLIK